MRKNNEKNLVKKGKGQKSLCLLETLILKSRTNIPAESIATSFSVNGDHSYSG